MAAPPTKARRTGLASAARSRGHATAKASGMEARRAETSRQARARFTTARPAKPETPKSGLANVDSRAQGPKAREEKT